MSNNLYYGSINKRFTNLDKAPLFADPNFVNPTSHTREGFKLKINSSAVDAGIAKLGPPIEGAGKGIFKNISKYPNKDFYGNLVNFKKQTPNIGACNVK